MTILIKSTEHGTPSTPTFPLNDGDNIESIHTEITPKI